MGDSDELWGDGDDEEFERLLIQTTQAAEDEEERRVQNIKNETASADGNGSGSFNHDQAVQAFDFRREGLAQLQGEDSGRLRTPSVSEPSSQINDLKTQLQKACGEKNIIRKKYQEVEEQLKSLTVKQISKEIELKKKYEAEMQQLRNRLAQASKEKDEFKHKLLSLQTRGSGSHLSVGGAQNFRQSSQTAASKYPSDPNLKCSSRQYSPSQSSFATSSKPQATVQELKKKVDLIHRNIQADPVVELKEEQDAEVLNECPINLGKWESIASLQMSNIRQEIFSKLKSLIELEEFEEVHPILQHIVSSAPREIMTTFVRGAEIKACFADVTDCMFQCGIDAQRKKDNAGNAEGDAKSQPVLPILHNRGIIDLKKSALRNIETHFVNGGAEQALKEIKELLKTFLEALYGENRCKLFEIENLQTLWSLLTWAKHFWKFVIYEEDVEDLAKLNEKDKDRTKELLAWTGIILKIDWRDLYVPELELLIRGLSLDILESIMTAGYFEETQRRYEILYSIIKDTLLKNHLRTDVLVRRCLVIITFAVADKKILNYLCLENNSGNCLAQLLGDYVLKCFKTTKDPYKSAQLVVYYLNLLETLMIRQPHHYHLSKIARSKVKNLAERKKGDFSSSDEETSDSEQAADDGFPPGHESMDVDSNCSQFACPDKYKFEDGCQERAKKFNKSSNVACWINPIEWENRGDSDSQLCQCRKTLVGSAFIMMHTVMQFWKDSYMKYQLIINENDMSDLEKVQQLPEMVIGENISKECLDKLAGKVQSLREFVVNQISDEAMTEEDDIIVNEYTWEKMLKSIEKQKDLRDSEWVMERRRPENVFDFVLRRSVFFISFFRKFSKNEALAISSEGYNSATLLECQLQFYKDEVVLTEVEKKVLSDWGAAEEGSGENYDQSNTNVPCVYEILDEDAEEKFADAVFLPEYDRNKILQGLPDTKFSEEGAEEFMTKAFEEMFRAKQ